MTENMTSQNIYLSSWDTLNSNSFTYYYRLYLSHIFPYFLGISNCESLHSDKIPKPLSSSVSFVSDSLRHVSTDVPISVSIWHMNQFPGREIHH
jgi:hypothetical protein